MKSQRQEQFKEREQQIIAVAETLLLENQNFTLDEIAKELDLAKGTLYKHFASKNELLMHLVIDNEQKVLELSQQYHQDINEYVPRYMLYHLLMPKKTIILHQIEEQLTMTASQTSLDFEHLYQIRQQRILAIRDMVEAYLKQVNYDISIRDYSSYVWSLTFGACLLLNSSYYQRSIGSRKKLINLYINQALIFPKIQINTDNFWDSETL
ncbi:TetR/AcrR family transcriptional regulator [Acinetobacter qingfengensis]|uniref:TetR family transcriptional regulator n=1 Tax=Acinetobacter qingfengensis TaxID=1262585 RepID=A0A1E7QXI3_9GAMM|nr:TetR/AcrR family transcriptional regulator [Acinetobacter qingfengensis]KAA8731681.1 TetR/AcrR family transcriptional regulator [Acinetobacter qingfengensis]OEY91784.1 TetR family transcriptional regulator [Acinetobacter qingfengensis]